MDSHNRSTQDSSYTDGLIQKQQVRWKKLLHVQAPYRWNLRRLRPGDVLEIGCGIGRNLDHLGGASVGIDHNPASVRVARQRHLTAFTPEEFRQTVLNAPDKFDTILLAHVLEHMTMAAGVALVREYLPNLKPQGRLIFISPQEAGYASDATHVEYMDFVALQNIHRELGARVIQEYSFPFPRYAGRYFPYNEFISVGQRAHAAPAQALPAPHLLTQ